MKHVIIVKKWVKLWQAYPAMGRCFARTVVMFAVYKTSRSNMRKRLCQIVTGSLQASPASALTGGQIQAAI
jgi:hypothetical protein